MWEERKIVKIIERYNLNNKTGLARKDFAEYIFEHKTWFKINYYFHNDLYIKNTINTILGDCILGSYQYIGRDDNGETLIVTARGRAFIALPFGFLEECLKRRKRISGVLFGSAISSAITGLIVHFWPQISLIWK